MAAGGAATSPSRVAMVPVDGSGLEGSARGLLAPSIAHAPTPPVSGSTTPAEDLPARAASGGDGAPARSAAPSRSAAEIASECRGLTEAIVLEFEEAFRFFDGDRDGFLVGAELGNVIRSLGFSPTDADLRALRRVVDEVYDGLLPFEGFCRLMASHVIPGMHQRPADGPRMREALRIFLEDCRGVPPEELDLGAISAADLEFLMTNVGDRVCLERRRRRGEDGGDGREEARLRIEWVCVFRR